MLLRNNSWLIGKAISKVRFFFFANIPTGQSGFILALDSWVGIKVKIVLKQICILNSRLRNQLTWRRWKCQVGRVPLEALICWPAVIGRGWELGEKIGSIWQSGMCQVFLKVMDVWNCRMLDIPVLGIDILTSVKSITLHDEHFFLATNIWENPRVLFCFICVSVSFVKSTNGCCVTRQRRRPSVNRDKNKFLSLIILDLCFVCKEIDKHGTGWLFTLGHEFLNSFMRCECCKDSK